MNEFVVFESLLYYSVYAFGVVYVVDEIAFSEVGGDFSVLARFLEYSRRRKMIEKIYHAFWPF